MSIPTTISVLLEMGLEETDTLVKYMKARKMTSLEVFRLAGNRSLTSVMLIMGGKSFIVSLVPCFFVPPLSHVR